MPRAAPSAPAAPRETLPAPEPAPPREAPWVRDPTADPWAQVLSAAAPNRRLRVLLNDCTLARVEDDLVVLSVTDALLTAAQANEKELCALLARAWDRAVRVELRSATTPNAAPGAPQPGAGSPAAPDGSSASPEPAEPLPDVTTLPLVRRTMELFNARLVGVQPRKPRT